MAVILNPMLTTAVKAARRAGGIITRAAGNLDLLTVQSKGQNDFVSEVDRQAEQAIVEILTDAYPNHAIVAEEGGATAEADYTWIIDPLDGTTNFIHGFPQYAVSIALQHRGVITQAVIFDPTRNDLYTASRGAGAYLNDRRIRVSRRKQMSDALIGTGFPYTHFEELDTYLDTLKRILPACAGVRRAGAAALDMAYVASGALDGFWEANLKPWDIAAGSLLISEAGGLLTDFNGDGDYLTSGNIVTATPKVFHALLKLVNPNAQ